MKNKRATLYRDRALEEWGQDIVRRDIIDALKEERAADRLPGTYPGNNFVLAGLAIAGVIVLVGLGYATGVIKP